MGWAYDELSRLDLGDARLNKRAATLAEAFGGELPASTRNLPRLT